MLITTVGVFVVTPFGGVTAGRVRIGTDTFEFTIKKDLMGHTQNSVDMQSINLCGNFIFAIFIV